MDAARVGLAVVEEERGNGRNFGAVIAGMFSCPVVYALLFIVRLWQASHGHIGSDLLMVADWREKSTPKTGLSLPCRNFQHTGSKMVSVIAVRVRFQNTPQQSGLVSFETFTEKRARI